MMTFQVMLELLICFKAFQNDFANCAGAPGLFFVILSYCSFDEIRVNAFTMHFTLLLLCWGMKDSKYWWGQVWRGVLSPPPCPQFIDIVEV